MANRNNVVPDEEVGSKIANEFWEAKHYWGEEVVVTILGMIGRRDGHSDRDRIFLEVDWNQAAVKADDNAV